MSNESLLGKSIELNACLLVKTLRNSMPNESLSGEISEPANTWPDVSDPLGNTMPHVPSPTYKGKKMERTNSSSFDHQSNTMMHLTSLTNLTVNQQNSSWILKPYSKSPEFQLDSQTLQSINRISAWFSNLTVNQQNFSWILKPYSKSTEFQLDSQTLQ